MAAKYYRKLSPETKPILGNGASVQFKTNDSVVGYFATDNEYIQGEFLRFASLQQYGITEITVEEFQNEYLAKKNYSGQLNQPWREEMGSGQSALRQISQFKEKLSAAVAVSGSDVPKSPVPIVAVTPTKEQIQQSPPKIEEFKPVTQKRGKPKT